jgi:hypothetical protein
MTSSSCPPAAPRRRVSDHRYPDGGPPPHLPHSVTPFSMHQSPDSGHTPNGFLPSPSGLARKRRKLFQPAIRRSLTTALPDAGQEPESGGLLEYWRILRRRKGTLIVLAGVGAVIGFLVTLPQTPIYQVRTSLEIVSLNQNFLNMKESNPLADSGSSADSTTSRPRSKSCKAAP